MVIYKLNFNSPFCCDHMYVCHAENWSAGTCWDNSFVSISRMYTMMEEHMKSTFNIHRHHILNISPSFSHSKKGSGCWSVKELCRGLRKLAVEGEEGEDGDQVGGELVLLQAPLHWVEKWGRQDFEQSLEKWHTSQNYFHIIMGHLGSQFSHWVALDWPLW